MCTHVRSSDLILGSEGYFLRSIQVGIPARQRKRLELYLLAMLSSPPAFAFYMFRPSGMCQGHTAMPPRAHPPISMGMWGSKGSNASAHWPVDTCPLVIAYHPLATLTDSCRSAPASHCHMVLSSTPDFIPGSCSWPEPGPKRVVAHCSFVSAEKY